MMFRSLFTTTLIACLTATIAQRPTATFISYGLVRLDLDGQRVFADDPGSAAPGTIDPEDVSLFAVEPEKPPVGGRTFTPSMTGVVLEHRTERLGERTGIYVRPFPTPLREVPHDSHLVQWSGRRIWFSGATTDPAELLAMTDLDLVFMNPAQLMAVQEAHRTIDARMIVVYRTTDREREGEAPDAPCERCRLLVPEPGETITLFR